MARPPALLHDGRCPRILAFRVSDVFLEVQDTLGEKAEPGQLISMFEGNPVMCAYGVCYGSQRR